MKLKFLFYLIFNIFIIHVLTQEKGSSLRKIEILSVDFQKNGKITVPSNTEKIIFNCTKFKKDEEIYFKITAKKFNDERIYFEFLDNLNGYLSFFHSLKYVYCTEKDDGLDKEVKYYTIKKSFYNLGSVQGKYLLIKFYCEGDVEIENIEKKEDKENLEEIEKNKTKDTVVSIIVVIIFLAVIIALIYYCYKKKRNAIFFNNKVLCTNRQYKKNINNGYNYNQPNQNFYYQGQMPQIQINQNNDINIDNGTIYRDFESNTNNNNNNYKSERNQINKRNNDNNGYSNSGGIYNSDHNSNNNCNWPNNNINNQQDNNAQINAINTSIPFNNNNNDQMNNNNINENDDNNNSNCLPSLEEINRAKRNIPQNDNNDKQSQTENLGAPDVAYNSNQVS